MQVKVICASFPSSLESDVNYWLKSNKQANVIDIKYSVDGASSMYRFSAMIIYN